MYTCHPFPSPCLLGLARKIGALVSALELTPSVPPSLLPSLPPSLLPSLPPSVPPPFLFVICAPCTVCNSSGDGSQQQQQQQQDGNRPSSFDHRAAADGGGIGYLNNPFQASRKQQQQQQQQQQQAYSASSSLRGQPSTSSMHSSRSPPSKTFDHHNTFEAPPGAFSTSAVPGPPNAPAPRSGSVGGGGGTDRSLSTVSSTVSSSCHSFSPAVVRFVFIYFILSSGGLVKTKA